MTPLFASRNRAAARLARTLARFAASDLPLLLEGETGTGKSHLARAAHRRSRSGRPLVVVDCGAIPETLLASELFGHVSGAFTDASRPRRGSLERAGDGTVVLDRIDALAPESQVVLLRMLEERVFTPVGSASARPLRARVVALAGADLTHRLGHGLLRADLYHRLAGYHAVLPPLRHRPEDILPFARRLLSRLARASGARHELDPEAERMALAYPWPGNFRELGTVLERASLLAGGGTIGAAELALPSGAWPEVAALAAARLVPLAEASRLYALWVLAAQGGNVSRAARVLGVSRRTLIRWRGVQ